MADSKFLIDLLSEDADEEKLVQRVMRLCDCDACRAKVRIADMRRQKEKVMKGGIINVGKES